MLTGKDIQRNGLEQYNRYYSIYSGIVADRNDPDKRGRLKLKVPVIYEDDVVHDYWAQPRSLFTGNNSGVGMIPQVGDTVWVSFLNGDPRYPVWEYGSWDDMNTVAELYNDNGEPDKLFIKSVSGQTIIIDDTNKTIDIKHSDGAEVIISKKSISLIIGDMQQISLGSKDTSTFKAALGDQVKDMFNQILQLCASATAAGSPLSNAANFTALISTLDNILSDKITLDK